MTLFSWVPELSTDMSDFFCLGGLAIVGAVMSGDISVAPFFLCPCAKNEQTKALATPTMHPVKKHIIPKAIMHANISVSLESPTMVVAK